jgi:hypothetical protein
MSYCGVSRPIEHFYQHAMTLSLLPTVFAGPIIGFIVTVAWWLVAIGSAVGFLWQMWRAVASATIERL